MSNRMSAAVERALARVDKGEKILTAAVKEGCHPSSIHRALASRKLAAPAPEAKKKPEPHKKKQP